MPTYFLQLLEDGTDTTKKRNSYNNLTAPDTAMGALPGSLGTRKVPQIAAMMSGKPAASSQLDTPSPILHPHRAYAASAASSRKNRKARLMG